MALIVPSYHLLIAQLPIILVPTYAEINANLRDYIQTS